MFQTSQLLSVLPAAFGNSARNQVARPLRLLALSVAVTAALSTGMAFAQNDDYAEVNRLMRAGQMSDALSKADSYLGTKPRDPQMRFIKGLIQFESGKPNDAIATFSKLSEDFPELPEPYNNLAVLYASQSQFDKARAALEMAIRTNPSYATAHENLGDVYAKLASQAYSKALQLDGSKTGVPPKLSLIRSIFVTDAKGIRPSVAVADVATPTVAPAKPTVSVAPVAQPAPAPDQLVSSDADVEAAVKAWAKAWSARNMNSYLGAYTADFTPGDGQSHQNWEAERKARIAPRSRIEVVVSDLSVTVNGNRATAKFQQEYSSDNFNASGRKSLDLVKSGGRWLIVREVSGS